MGSRLGRRLVHFANLPIKLLMPTSFTNIKEIALKTIPSASKIEIKRVLESLYGFEVEKVETLNMDGKKKKRGGLLIAKPDYKKAYVTLKHPLSLNPELFPIRAIEEDKMNTRKKSAASSIVEDPDAVKKSHWLDESRDDGGRVSNSRIFRRRVVDRRPAKTGEKAPRAVPPPPPPPPPAKFPWSSMKGLGK